MFDKIVRYFNLQSNNPRATPEGGADAGGHAPVLPQYLVVSLGVIMEPLLRHYIEHGAWEVSWSDVIGQVIFGLVIGLIILPGVYKSAFDQSKPIFVQLAALFPLGIGWQSLYTTATQAVAS